jgi:Fe-S-cluster containining protein
MPADKQSIPFKCQQCSACCRQAGFVYLQSGEAERIAAFLKMDDFTFVNEHCELQDRQKLVLRKAADETCIFLSEKGCLIHPVKPKQCRDFPIGWKTPGSLHYCEGLRGDAS